MMGIDGEKKIEYHTSTTVPSRTNHQPNEQQTKEEEQQEKCNPIKEQCICPENVHDEPKLEQYYRYRNLQATNAFPEQREHHDPQREKQETEQRENPSPMQTASPLLMSSSRTSSVMPRLLITSPSTTPYSSFVSKTLQSPRRLQLNDQMYRNSLHPSPHRRYWNRRPTKTSMRKPQRCKQQPEQLAANEHDNDQLTHLQSSVRATPKPMYDRTVVETNSSERKENTTTQDTSSSSSPITTPDPSLEGGNMNKENNYRNNKSNTVFDETMTNKMVAIKTHEIIATTKNASQPQSGEESFLSNSPAAPEESCSSNEKNTSRLSQHSSSKYSDKCDGDGQDSNEHLHDQDSSENGIESDGSTYSDDHMSVSSVTNDLDTSMGKHDKQPKQGDECFDDYDDDDDYDDYDDHDDDGDDDDDAFTEHGGNDFLTTISVEVFEEEGEIKQSVEARPAATAAKLMDLLLDPFLCGKTSLEEGALRQDSSHISSSTTQKAPMAKTNDGDHDKEEDSILDGDGDADADDDNDDDDNDNDGKCDIGGGLLDPFLLPGQAGGVTCGSDIDSEDSSDCADGVDGNYRLHYCHETGDEYEFFIYNACTPDYGRKSHPWMTKHFHDRNFTERYDTEYYDYDTEDMDSINISSQHSEKISCTSNNDSSSVEITFEPVGDDGSSNSDEKGDRGHGDSSSVTNGDGGDEEMYQSKD